MQIFKNYKSPFVPTCMKEILEKKNKEVKIKQNQPIRLEDFVFVSTEPYPELVDVIPNQQDVKELKKNVAGRESELSAITTYLYQQYILEPNFEDIAKILEQIGIVEMTHYELLNGAIVAFGGNPNLTDGMGNVWTGRNVNTEKNLKKLLQDDLKSEQDAIKEYERAARETNNKSLAQLYLRIAEDEKLHVVILTKLLDLIE